MKPLGIPGAWTEEKKLFRDDRGSFHEWFRNDALHTATGREMDVRQANCAVSRKGVLRGIHFTENPPGQAKYVTCLRGAVVGAVVDIRVGSPTFGQWRTAELDDTNCAALYVSEGLGFGFMAVSDEATVIYLSSATYDPKREHGLDPLDPELGIQWPADITPVVSDRDASAPGLARAGELGLLPVYSD
ncbi:dTDP-4-dehydrorhamnose 3,5-epimerase [Streptomyces sp. NBC_00209]|uniref:dTDP-4-dehydrorhamnose 3,5-epimerase family protein n=1 Tax=Streptomyces sp. NBC_00209 TaxID=2975682 RepID=UPI002F908E0F